MTNEEFQRIVIEALKELREGQKALENRQSNLEEGQKDLSKIVKAIQEQTAWLTEYRTQTEEKINNMVSDDEAIKDIIGRHEVEINKLKRKIG